MPTTAAPVVVSAVSTPPQPSQHHLLHITDKTALPKSGPGEKRGTNGPGGKRGTNGPGEKRAAILLQQNTHSPPRPHPLPPCPPSAPSVPCKSTCETYTLSSGGMYVSRVSNILISQCKKATPYVPLKCSSREDVAFNKRVCLDSSAVTANTFKVSGKSYSPVSNGNSQVTVPCSSLPGQVSGSNGTFQVTVPCFLMVRRGHNSSDGGLCWADNASHRQPVMQLQPHVNITATTTMPCLSTTTRITSSPAEPQAPLPCRSPWPGPVPTAIGALGPGKKKEVVQEHPKERRHMKAINDAFQVLRRALPWVGGGTLTEQRPLGTARSKINTITLAVRYIRALEHLLDDGNEDGESSSSSEKSSSSQSSSCSPSPALSRTSLRSVGSDFSDLISSDSFEDLDALDELVALSEAGPDALMSDTNEMLTT